MEDIKNIVAKNISALRQKNNMTQLELAEKVNYSDKAISKWERAESSPDISVLVQLADIFGVTLDFLVKGDYTEKETTGKPSNKKTYNRRPIAYISECAAWFVAILAFIITTLIIKRVTFQTVYFFYALPVSMIVKLVFISVWFNPRHKYYIISVLMWSVLAAIQVTFLLFKINVVLIYLLGIAGQLVIILWSLICKPKK